MGYSLTRVRALEMTINAVDCDTVLFCDSHRSRRLLRISKPAVRVRYALADMSKPTLGDENRSFSDKRLKNRLFRSRNIFIIEVPSTRDPNIARAHDVYTY